MTEQRLPQTEAIHEMPPIGKGQEQEVRWDALPERGRPERAQAEAAGWGPSAGAGNCGIAQSKIE